MPKSMRLTQGKPYHIHLVSVTDRQSDFFHVHTVPFSGTLRCTFEVINGFRVEGGLQQGLALSPFLFINGIYRLTDGVRQVSLWTMMFVDDIVIFGESREQVEKKTQRG